MYLIYPEYKSYGGTLDEAAFVNYEYQAEVLINWYTFGRLKKDNVIPEEVKRLIVVLIALADLRNKSLTVGASADGESTAGITSQSNDGVSISYNGMSATNVFSTCKREAIQCIKQYLDGVVNEAGQKLLYRGLYPGE